jgi:hypothetical protein
VSFALPESLTYLVARNASNHVIREQFANVVPGLVTTDSTRFVYSKRRIRTGTSGRTTTLLIPEHQRPAMPDLPGPPTSQFSSAKGAHHDNSP